MRKGYRPWSNEELKSARDLKNAKWSNAQIGEELGRTGSAVSVMLSLESHGRRQLQQSQHEHVINLRISDQQLAERESRQEAAYQRDTTALLMGDPPPGYSARDRS